MERTYDTMRCITCGTPMCDHVPIRYAIRAWVKHRLCLSIGYICGRFLRDINADY